MASLVLPAPAAQRPPRPERSLASIVEATAYAAIDEILPMGIGVPRLMDRPPAIALSSISRSDGPQVPEREGKVDQQPPGAVAFECAIAPCESQCRPIVDRRNDLIRVARIASDIHSSREFSSNCEPVSPPMRTDLQTGYATIRGKGIFLAETARREALKTDYWYNFGFTECLTLHA